MIYDHLEFHNTAALEPATGIDGKLLVRVPKEVRDRLNPRARFVAMESVGSEIRFVTEAPTVHLYLSCTKPEFAAALELRVFRGNFEYQSGMFEPLRPGVINTIVLNAPDFTPVPEEKLSPRGFHSNVWRIRFNRGVGIYCGIDTLGSPVRPPLPGEKPALTMLCYGSSITHSNVDGYPFVAARRLGIDVINLGMSGACRCEPEIADHIAGRADWDMLTIEFGINALDLEPEEFEKRLTNLLDTLQLHRPGKPVALITLYPFRERIAGIDGNAFRRDAAFCAILRKLAPRYSDIRLIEGSEILTDFTALSADLLHPTGYGHALMGFELAAQLRAQFPGLRFD